MKNMKPSPCQDIILWCIHGNLQHPEVWDQFQGRFNILSAGNLPLIISIQKENLWLHIEDNFSKWISQFCENVKMLSSSSSDYLLGYSLGGRLAFHAAIHSPQLFKGIIIVSADPGLKNGRDQAVQLARDKEWGARFLSEPWGKLITDWDNQEVFKGSKSAFERKESDYSREKIAMMFDVFSKGRQTDLSSDLAMLNEGSPRILYLSGEYDQRYSKIGYTLHQQCPNVSHCVIDKAGHRVPWDTPDKFIRVVKNFISDCESN